MTQIVASEVRRDIQNVMDSAALDDVEVEDYVLPTTSTTASSSFLRTLETRLEEIAAERNGGEAGASSTSSARPSTFNFAEAVEGLSLELEQQVKAW